MSAITLTVNGRSHSLDVDPTTPLLYVLSDDLDLRGPKFGCGLAQCGACTVIAGGRAIRSCVTPVEAMDGADITTLEGLGTAESVNDRWLSGARSFGHGKMTFPLLEASQLSTISRTLSLVTRGVQDVVTTHEELMT